MGQLCTKQQSDHDVETKSSSKILNPISLCGCRFENDDSNYGEMNQIDGYERDSTQAELNNFNFFYLQNNELMPQQLRAKQIRNLIEIRHRVIEKMLIHVDKYNGFCPNHEVLISCIYKGEDMVKSMCLKGQQLNNQMIQISKYLEELGFSDENNEKEKILNMKLIVQL